VTPDDSVRTRPMCKARPIPYGTGPAVYSGGTVADSHGLPFVCRQGRRVPGLLVTETKSMHRDFVCQSSFSHEQ